MTLRTLAQAELTVQAYRSIGVESYSSAVFCFVPDNAMACHQAIEAGDDRTVRELRAAFYLPFVALRDKVPG